MSEKSIRSPRTPLQIALKRGGMLLDMATAIALIGPLLVFPGGILDGPWWQVHSGIAVPVIGSATRGQAVALIGGCVLLLGSVRNVYKGIRLRQDLGWYRRRRQAQEPG